MKKYIILSILTGASFTVSACNTENINNRVVQQNKVLIQEQKFGYINLDIKNFKLKTESFNTKSVNSPNPNLVDFSNKSLYKYKVEITGPGITTPILSEFVPAIPVPVGKNRIVSLNVYDLEDGLLASISGVGDIVAGQTNTISLSYFDSLLAQIIRGIMDGSNSSLASSLDISLLKTSLKDLTGYDSTKKTFSKIDPVSINPLKISEFMSANNGTFPPATTSGLTGFASLVLNLNVSDTIIYLSDLNSSPTNISNSKSKTINNIMPGKWKLTVFKSGYKTSVTDIAINSTATNTVTINMVEKDVKTIDGGVGGD